jgi:uncharacterized membrane-anchored protein
MTSLLLLSLGGVIYLLAVTRVWQASKGLAIGMLLLSPIGLYVLVRYWNDKDLGVRMPLLAAIALFGVSWALFLRDAQELQRYADATAAIEGATPPMPARTRGGGALDDKLRLSIALAKLQPRGGRVEIAPAAAALDVPAHFRFIDRDGLQALYEEVGGSLNPSSMGWLVHESVELGAEDAWFVEIEWLGDGYVRENGFATRTRDQMFVDAQDALARLSELQGEDEPGFRLVRYVEVPSFDVGRDSATWVEELAYEGDDAHRLDCYAAKLGRRGVLLFSVLEVGTKRQELCLRSVRLAAGRIAFDQGQAYADYSRLFDRKAKYDLAAVVSGAAALQEP